MKIYTSVALEWVYVPWKRFPLHSSGFQLPGKNKLGQRHSLAISLGPWESTNLIAIENVWKKSINSGNVLWARELVRENM